MTAHDEAVEAAALMAQGQPYDVPGHGGGRGTVNRWWAEDAAAAIRALPLSGEET